jgi:hypothetical protein
VKCVWNLVSGIKRGTQTQYVWEHVAEVDTWTGERWRDGKLGETAQWGALSSSPVTEDEMGMERRMNGEEVYAYRILMGKPEIKRQQ